MWLVPPPELRSHPKEKKEEKQAEARHSLFSPWQAKHGDTRSPTLSSHGCACPTVINLFPSNCELHLITKRELTNTLLLADQGGCGCLVCTVMKSCDEFVCGKHRMLTSRESQVALWHKPHFP